MEQIMEGQPRSDKESETQKPLGLVEFYEKVFGWRVIEWDKEAKVWCYKKSADSPPRALDARYVITAHSQKQSFTGEDSDFGATVGAIEVDDISRYDEAIVENGGKIDSSLRINNLDGSAWNIGHDSTGRTFILVELSPETR